MLLSPRLWSVTPWESRWVVAETTIEWTRGPNGENGFTFNPWYGCTKVSPACDHCYAEGWAKRSGLVQWGPGAERRRSSDANWKLPLKWNAEAERLGVRYRVFCASLADVFDNSVPQEWREDLFTLIEQTPYLDWLLLTKRIGNVANMLPVPFDFGRLYPNVWIGATICNQEEADRDIPKLLRVPAAKRFLSMEPLLGPVELQFHIYSEPTGNFRTHEGKRQIELRKPADGGLHWVIVGGESGPNARPLHPDWVRSLRDQCQAAGVAFFFKQHGEWLATDFCDDAMAMIPLKRLAYVRKDGSFHDDPQKADPVGGEQETAWIGKKAAGRMLDGREWNEVPKC